MPTPSRQTRVVRPNTPTLPMGDSVIHRIKPISASQPYIKMVLYGVSGSGKTTFWATFPGPILVILASGGKNPGELMSINTPEYRGKIDQVVLRETSEFREIIEHLKDFTHYKTVVLDHATGYQDLVLKEILGLHEIPVQKNWGIASQQQYGQAVAQCKEAFRHLLNLSANVVFVGQERESKRDSGDSELILPKVGIDLMPQLAGWLNPAVDYIVQTCIRPRFRQVQTQMAGETVTMQERVRGAVDYCLRTGPDAVYTTKFRKPKGELPEFIVDADYDKILALINGEQE